ncbi:MAG TPA: hypothetical protein VJ714_09735 [Anaerolineae bacterium]|nr:hypothetical protein [Anaerolineae bacterium]
MKVGTIPLVAVDEASAVAASAVPETGEGWRLEMGRAVRGRLVGIA